MAAPVPAGPVDRAALDEARRRADRTTGSVLLFLGILVTISNMAMTTENALAAQFAAVFHGYGIEQYRRPDGLAALSIAGILGYPLIYALTLYTALLRWRRKRRAMWVVVLGGLATVVFSFALIMAGMTMHPELIELASRGAPPSPTP